MASSPSIVWFRQDLRLDDNPAVNAAIERGGPVIPLFIWAPDDETPWQPGAASRVWLHESLGSLAEDLRAVGSRLILRIGESQAVLDQLIAETGAEAIYWNRRYEPVAIARDKTIKATLRSRGLLVETFNGNLLFEPWEIETNNGGPYKVFTPFWKACQSRPEPEPPRPVPETIAAPESWPQGEPLEALALRPDIPWDEGIRDAWLPGEDGAMDRLHGFAQEGAGDYPEDRDRPDLEGTSRLSPHLHFGEVSPRRVWHMLKAAASGQEAAVADYLRQLGWREFAHHLLYHFPDTTDAPLRPEFADFPWADDEGVVKAWQRGKTGYPIVDAGMRELWTTGWMHNRVRMIVASFLTKDLLIPWQTGARWFWDTLVDADLANNTLGWQWTAGCGADAAPYFRIFNPVRQGERFDPDGAYVRQWVLELDGLPAKWIHRPWEAPADVLKEARIDLGKTYPQPIVDHAEARDRALQAYERIKKS